MKELKIKEYSLKEDADNPVTTKFFATQVIKSPADNGYTIDEVLSRTRLQNTVNNAVDVIAFEDADFKVFVELLNKSKWTFSHEDLADFIIEVKGL